jgi:hypothetical protein
MAATDNHRVVGLGRSGISCHPSSALGRAHTNPPVTGEPVWDSACTRQIAVKY